MRSKRNYRIHVVLIFLAMVGVLSCTNRPQVKDEDYSWEISDSTLRNAVREEFNTHPFVSTADVKIKAEDGIVTLFGTTDNLIEKEKAADIASMIRGVKGVINLIEVKTPFVANDVLKANIDDALYKDPVLESYDIIIKADSGVVSLYGRVNSWHEKQLASDVVKTITGVKKVNNNIAFVYQKQRPDMDIEADIISLLRNDARIQDGMINVKVNNDTVTLSGKVGSAAEKSLAIVNAWVAGVDTVLSDKLEVSPDDINALMREDKYVKKSDPEIIQAIQQVFLQDPRLLNHDIKVQSDSGHVTLTGAVSNLRAKKAAGNDATNVVGVWSVKNHITVKPLAFPIEKTVVDNVTEAIQHHPMFENYQIKAISNDSGKVTLEGKVKFYFEKTQAEDVASKVPGVVDVANNIEVSAGISFPYAITPETKNYPVLKKPQLISDAEIKKNVEYQLWWSPFVDRNQVKVSVKNGKVTLSGTVNTRYEMDAAVRNAYEGGAFEVINHLKVDFWEI